MKLRAYQQEAIERVIAAANKHIYKQLIVLPTGAGKTIIMAAIAKHFNTRILILAHRKELIQQAHDKIKMYWPEADIGICQAGKNDIDNQIVIGSMQSCQNDKRLNQLHKQNFSLMIIDEAHHVEADSYQRIIKKLGFYEGTKLLIGLTATPQRTDKRGLGNTFDKIVFSRSIGDLIANDYLPPVIGRKLLTDLSLNGIKNYKGDFQKKQLASAINSGKRNQFIVDKYLQYASDRKVLAFCASVQHCKDLAIAFSQSEVKASAVWGNMPQKEREQVLHDFHIGLIQVVTSCELLTEGFDEETISAIIMARPTKSKSLYIQMVGRGLRKSPEKKDCLVLDFSDKGHNLNNRIFLSNAIPEATIIGKKTGKKIQSRNLNEEAQIEKDREFDILGIASFVWVKINNQEWSMLDDDKNEIVISHHAEGFIANLFLKDGNYRSLIQDPLPLSFCLKECENFARKNLNVRFANLTWLEKDEPPTQKQLAYLSYKKCRDKPSSKIEASFCIKSIIALENQKKRMTIVTR